MQYFMHKSKVCISQLSKYVLISCMHNKFKWYLCDNVTIILCFLLMGSSQDSAKTLDNYLFFPNSRSVKGKYRFCCQIAKYNLKNVSGDYEMHRKHIFGRFWVNTPTNVSRRPPLESVIRSMLKSLWVFTNGTCGSEFKDERDQSNRLKELAIFVR